MTCVRAIRPISRMGPKAKTQPTPLPCTMVSRTTSRQAEVLAVLRANRLEPKRLAFVKNKADGAPWLFLVEAQKNRKTGLRVEPDVLISAGAALYGR